ncbi:hypothetical protein P7K49_010295 [Saguinus oedipus]|uniref:Uncharacterized protein n=1 Tax=Saguinus oedipus TaxID=9490 RepID=A0ABQ9VMF4_SAGOE|nr:hypothetical protein P7K49_010295 [Saguinus oedipus]
MEGSQEEVGRTDHPTVSARVPGVAPGSSSPPHLAPPRFVRGFILRHAPRCPENAFFLDHLLLTPNAVVIVEDAKVKQRIEYANLTGQPESRAVGEGPALTPDL